MSKIITRPILAISIVLTACGSSATETPSATSFNITTTSTAGMQSFQALVPPSIIGPGPNMTPIPGPTALTTSTRNTPVPPAASAIAVVIVEQPAVGTDVGDTIPHFEFTLFDSTKSSTAQLSSQGGPVFLFFFATW